MKLVVAPLHEAEGALAAHRPSHVLSLGSPDGPHAEFAHHGPRLRLVFNDIAGPRPGLVEPAASHVRRLLEFSRDWDAARPMLIHCWAGVSRSPAAAYIVACSRTPSGEERRLAEALRRAAPFATPNPLLIEIADGLLDRGGAMVEAVRSIGRGEEVGRGGSFALRLSSGPAVPSRGI